ncbi:Cysteine protease atg4b [Mortierella polycephala]|uniref:Autophagy-related protein 4 n=1 Tax=Mortierella polycephala TaxID=41804 RepID=A0A9P6Q428_9FUNG|nr:Cysteine protease atg4b [Mortierella polycephala]
MQSLQVDSAHSSGKSRNRKSLPTPSSSSSLSSSSSSSNATRREKYASSQLAANISGTKTLPVFQSTDPSVTAASSAAPSATLAAAVGPVSSEVPSDLLPRDNIEFWASLYAQHPVHTLQKSTTESSPSATDFTSATGKHKNRRGPINVLQILTKTDTEHPDHCQFRRLPVKTSRTSASTVLALPSGPFSIVLFFTVDDLSSPGLYPPLQRHTSSLPTTTLWYSTSAYTRSKTVQEQRELMGSFLPNHSDPSSQTVNSEAVAPFYIYETQVIGTDMVRGEDALVLNMRLSSPEGVVYSELSYTLFKGHEGRGLMDGHNNNTGRSVKPRRRDTVATPYATSERDRDLVRGIDATGYDGAFDMIGEEFDLVESTAVSQPGGPGEPDAGEHLVQATSQFFTKMGYWLYNSRVVQYISRDDRVRTKAAFQERDIWMLGTRYRLRPSSQRKALALKAQDTQTGHDQESMRNGIVSNAQDRIESEKMPDVEKASAGRSRHSRTHSSTSAATPSPSMTSLDNRSYSQSRSTRASRTASPIPEDTEPPPHLYYSTTVSAPASVSVSPETPRSSLLSKFTKLNLSHGDPSYKDDSHRQSSRQADQEVDTTGIQPNDALGSMAPRRERKRKTSKVAAGAELDDIESSLVPSYPESTPEGDQLNSSTPNLPASISGRQRSSAISSSRRQNSMPISKVFAAGETIPSLPSSSSQSSTTASSGSVLRRSWRSLSLSLASARSALPLGLSSPSLSSGFSRSFGMGDMHEKDTHRYAHGNEDCDGLIALPHSTIAYLSLLHPGPSSSLSSSSTPASSSSTGKNLTEEQEILKQFIMDFQSRLWFTYRKDLQRIEPSFYTCDSGWGCMMRTGQSLLAQGFLQATLGRGWRAHLPQTDKTRRRYKRILNWFVDEPDREYSIHRIAKEGLALDKRIGEWFGPSTVAHAFKRLSEGHRKCPLTILVPMDGTVRISEVIGAATTAQTTSSTRSSSGSTAVETKWKPVMLMIPVRLGLDKLTAKYRRNLRQLFRMPQFLGIAGGRPSRSLYFVACQGDELFYYDPHFIKPRITSEELSVCPAPSFHCPVVRTMDILELDPSMLLGFLIESPSALEDLVVRFKQDMEQAYPLLTIVEDDGTANPTRFLYSERMPLVHEEQEQGRSVGKDMDAVRCRTKKDDCGMVLAEDVERDEEDEDAFLVIE